MISAPTDNDNLKKCTIMTYEEVITSSPVVLVEFYASWCPHCRRMMPVVEQIKELVDGKATIVQLDIDDNGEVADKAGASSVPTFIIYSDGAEVWRQSGEMDADYLLGNIEKYL